jgi:hypothetical protein
VQWRSVKHENRMADIGVAVGGVIRWNRDLRRTRDAKQASQDQAS